MNLSRLHPLLKHFHAVCICLTAVSIFFFSFSPTQASESRIEKSFRFIADYHLNVANEQQLFQYFVESLRRIDARFEVYLAENNLRLTYNGHLIQHWNLPQDPRAWGKLTADMMHVAKNLLPQTAAQEFDANLLQATLKSLDPFSHTAPSNGSKGQSIAELGRSMRGSIGLSVEAKHNAVFVYSTLADAPAASYLQKGDRILTIDGKAVDGFSAKETVALLWGEMAQSVNLRVMRGERLLEFDIPRNLSRESDLQYRRDPTGVQILRLERFAAGSAARAAAVIERNPNQPLLIDLRGNRGGVLEEAIAIADLFLDDGIIVSMSGRHEKARQHFEAQDGKFYTMPIAVLMDSETASAAEVLAGALQDHARATLIGSKSYGKNVVQRLQSIDGDLALAVSWAKIRLPNPEGERRFEGLQPDICTVSTQPQEKQLPPEPGKEFVWLRRAPQVSWDSRNCPKEPLKNDRRVLQNALNYLQQQALSAPVRPKII